MNFVRLIPVVLSLLLLSAHFSRSGISILSVLFLIVPFLLMIRKQWIPTLMKIVLALGSIEWIRTLIVYIGQRHASGEPYFRLILIIGTVTLFTVASIMVFKNKKLREFYSPN